MSYTDYYKNNSNTPNSDSTDISPEDARKLAIKRRLEQATGKTPGATRKSSKSVRLMR